ncbi:MAG TPA: NADH-quinone oxidoreductase subunit J [Candidatus Acidoferrum sp.]|jgi:NADH-quinone oxidoreductase subunit J|nr:NADH-quinone oxidoreductase subunit J [Candidatus Acidoferrum sp.]
MLTSACLATVTLAGALAAMCLRNLVHCALALAVSFTGLAAVYLQLDAQFVGFAQILVYVGAVAILIVFAIQLTRGSEPPRQPIFSSTWLAGAGVGAAVFALLTGLVLSSKAARGELPPAPETSVAQIGNKLMTHYILPLEVLGLLLTAALIGAVLIAMHERRTE